MKSLDHVKRWKSMLPALIRNSPPLLTLYYLLTDRVGALAYLAGWVGARSGAVHAGLGADESVAYIERVFAQYRAASRRERFTGAAAEVGPGDNAGVALLFLGDGCVSVDLIDRFLTHRSEAHQAEVYRALIEGHPSLRERLRAPDVLTEDSFHGLHRRSGPGAAAEVFFEREAAFDVIYSCAAMEHLSDPVTALRMMGRALRPGGLMLHQVDLRDHRLYSDAHHELTFLTVPEWLYPWMTRGLGRPNRVPLPAYRAALTGIPGRLEILVNGLVGVGPLPTTIPWDKIDTNLRKQALAAVAKLGRPLASPFQGVPASDLAINSFMLRFEREGTIR